ncbi:MAG: WhiB family transcriptional regulator [Candidatus Spechtbacterales bacterium]|nr:WhiB family transcriptional regulator [Candidatus Spechtbacterales bacterium]
MIPNTATVEAHIGIAEALKVFEWHKYAACRDYPSELFISQTTGKRDSKKALEICSGCNVQEECLENELRFPQTKDANYITAAGGKTRHRREILSRKRSKT